MDKGTKVRFIGGPYGVVEHWDAVKFQPEVVKEGDTGTYFGEHPHPRMDGWHLIAVNLGGRDLGCRCTVAASRPSMLSDSDREQVALGAAILHRLVPAPDHGAGFRRDPETGFVYYASEWLSDESAAKDSE